MRTRVLTESTFVVRARLFALSSIIVNANKLMQRLTASSYCLEALPELTRNLILHAISGVRVRRIWASRARRRSAWAACRRL